MSGYCAIGRLKTAIPPASVMMIDITEAKIGRLMKKLENIDPLTSVPRVRPVDVRGEVVLPGRVAAADFDRLVVLRESAGARSPAAWSRQPPRAGRNGASLCRARVSRAAA